ncbi:MAG: hypothetical protein ACRDQ1_18495 [Sciscionella sp.]
MESVEHDSFDVVSPRGKVVGPSGTSGEAPEPGYEPSRVVCRGSYDEVLDYLDQRMWTDGLPIVPPTIPRIERMLTHTHREPAEVIGAVGDEGIEATVWNTAVNAVMAGCRDQDFPIVLTLVEILADPAFRIRDAGSTTGWEVLALVSGPDLPERGFNTETGVMRLGRRANSSIGRFTRLWIRNIAGLLIPPGTRIWPPSGSPSTLPWRKVTRLRGSSAGRPAAKNGVTHQLTSSSRRRASSG